MSKTSPRTKIPCGDAEVEISEASIFSRLSEGPGHSVASRLTEEGHVSGPPRPLFEAI